MKMAMRLDKSQVKSVQKFTTPGAATFKRTVAIMAGYKTFDILVVGAAGGTAGTAITDTNNESDRAYMYGSGGGGGGSIRLQGSLVTDLGGDPTVNPTLNVGAAGTTGSDGTSNAKAGNGTAGGDSDFLGYTARGGKGGIGGDFDAIIRNQPNVNPNKIEFDVVAEGGLGGEAVQAYAMLGGEGGNVRMEGINSSGSLFVVNQSLPVDGGYSSSAPSAPVVSSGKGGGGGGGRYKSVGSYTRDPQAGASGAVGGTNSSAPGQVAPTANVGGRGGGANLQPVTGVAEYYGGGETNPNGAVAIKLS